MQDIFIYGVIVLPFIKNINIPFGVISVFSYMNRCLCQLTRSMPYVNSYRQTPQGQGQGSKDFTGMLPVVHAFELYVYSIQADRGESKDSGVID